jgi:hypothetical protein
LADESPKLDSDVVVLPNLVTTSKNLFFFITKKLPKGYSVCSCRTF